MKLANVHVKLDAHNAVPKWGVTAAEIALLRAIHGPEAVYDIEPAGEVERSNGVELARLHDLYGAARDEDNRPMLRTVFPVASSLHQNLDDLGLDESLFKAKSRAKADDAPTQQAQKQAESQSGRTSSPDDGDPFADGSPPKAAEPAVNPHADAFA